MAESKLVFHWADYVVFAASLAVCTVIGLVQGIRDRWGIRKPPPKKGEEQDERQLSLFPVVWSIVATSFSSNFVLGFPAEMYYVGTGFGVACIGFAIGLPTALIMFVKKFYELRIPSVFEYIGLRFGNELKYFLTVLYALAMLIYMGLIIYAPALAFGRSANMPIWLAVLVTGVICIVYTTLGGLKGVLWIDTLQMVVVLGVGLAMCAYGTQQVGGLGEVWELATNSSRIEWTPWDADPTIRHSFWSTTVGGMVVIWLLVTNQAITQKFLGLPSMKQVYVAGFSYIVVVELFCCIYMMAGIVIYGYYAKIGCEPTLSQLTERADQLVPHFVLDIFIDAPGVAGLFTAAVFGASLSTVSAGINALAALTMRDVVQTIYVKKTGKPLTNPLRGVMWFKGLSVIWGAVALGIAFLAPLLGRSILQIGLSVLSMASGPLVGVLILGMYVPFTEKIGAFVGVLSAMIFEFTLLIGSTLYPVDPALKSLSPGYCPVENSTEPMTTPYITAAAAAQMSTTAMSELEPESSGASKFFEVSYLLYAPLGILITIVMTFIVSSFVRWCKGQVEWSEVEDRLLCYCSIPKNKRKQKENDDKNPASYHNGGYVGEKYDKPAEVDDITPVIKQTSDLPTAYSLAFARDNPAYIKGNQDGSISIQL